jgi:hypothetical protein
MSLYMIERNFAEQVSLNDETIDGVKLVAGQEGNRWLFSFLSSDRKKMYCLYEAPNADTIIAAAKRLGLPADVILPVDEIRP